MLVFIVDNVIKPLAIIGSVVVAIVCLKRFIDEHCPKK